jgi:hypothetical protein
MPRFPGVSHSSPYLVFVLTVLKGAGSLQVTTKALDNSQSIVTIKERDLRTPEQQKVSSDSFAKSTRRMLTYSLIGLGFQAKLGS